VVACPAVTRVSLQVDASGRSGTGGVAGQAEGFAHRLGTRPIDANHRLGARFPAPPAVDRITRDVEAGATTLRQTGRAECVRGAQAIDARLVRAAGEPAAATMRRVARGVGADAIATLLSERAVEDARASLAIAFLAWPTGDFDADTAARVHRLAWSARGWLALVDRQVARLARRARRDTAAEGRVVALTRSTRNQDTGARRRIAELARATGYEASTARLVAELARLAADLAAIGLPRCPHLAREHTDGAGEGNPHQRPQRLSPRRSGDGTSQCVETISVHLGTSEAMAASSGLRRRPWLMTQEAKANFIRTEWWR
jgi:hypothetical protein